MRGITTGEISADKPRTIQKLIRREFPMALLLGGALSCIMFFRVFITSHNFSVALALSVTMFFIVLVSIFMGAFVPLTLSKFGFDPARLVN